MAFARTKKRPHNEVSFHVYISSFAPSANTLASNSDANPLM